MQSLPITFASRVTLWASLAAVALVVLPSLFRRPTLPALSKLLGVVALLLLAVAAGGPEWQRRGAPEVVVMVDLSPSTRGARYRDPAVLRERVRQLLGDAPHRLLYFAGDRPVDNPPRSDEGGTLADMPTRRTVFSPPAAAMVLLFSDARFDPPAVAPPTFVVVDGALEEPADAAVERMEVRGNELAVTVRNAGGPRTLSLVGLSAAEEIPIPAGGLVVTRRVPEGMATRTVTARLSGGDLWTENDALSLVLPPPAQAEQWRVGAAAGAEGWRGMRPVQLPDDPAAYLAPSVIVLDNVPASDLTDLQQQRLREYVRDLGGGLVILGGDRAFAAGGYAGRALDALSPLASHPPQPSSHWVFVVDSSGSMNSPVPGGGTRWRAAVDAVARAVGSLPAHDLVSVAGFAAGVEWWWRGRTVADARTASLPPPGVRPSGPTELARALEAVTVDAGQGPPVELVALTDASAPVADPAAIADLMRARKVRLHLLALGDERAEGLTPLRRVVEATGGTLLREAEPAGWADAVRRLTRAAAPDLLIKVPAAVTFTGALAGETPRTAAPPWNRTWLKPAAEEVARIAYDGGEPTVGAAAWAIGEGRVAAAAFGAPAGEAEPFVRLVARPPRDPRLRVAWEFGERVRVTIDAGGDAGPVLNGLPLELELRDAGDAGPAARSLPVPQVGPGRYELAVDAPEAAAVATLQHAGRAVDRAAVAARYPPEFEKVGNDRGAMREMAAWSGASVVEPSRSAPLRTSRSAPLRTPRAGGAFPLSPPLAAAAAACLALALIRWRLAT